MKAASDAEVSRGSISFLRVLTVLVALVVLGFLIHAARGFGDDSDSPPAPVDSVDPAAAELAAFVDEAVAFIEGVRGQTFKQQPVVKLVEAAEFVELILADIRAELADDPEWAESATVFNRALGLFSPDQEIEEVYGIFVQGGVLGAYFPATDQLLVRAAPALSLSVKSTIVHELVHAYDDQWFDLDRYGASTDTTEQPWTFGAAVEGSASYVEGLWRAELDAEQTSALSAEELEVGAPDALFELDFAFLLLEFSVYEYGEPWVAGLVAGGGMAALDAVIAEPVATSEEVMEASRPTELAVIDVAAPHVDGEIVWQGAGGQVLLDSMFAATGAGTSEAARGWGGDAMTLYRGAGGESCVRWDIAMDTAADSKELGAALETWADLRGGEVAVVAGLVRLDRCS